MYFNILPKLFIAVFVIFFIHSNIKVDGSYTRFVYSDDINGIRVCGFQLSQFFSKWCHNYKVHLEKTIGVENTMNLNYKSLNRKNRGISDEEQKYLYGKLTEFCCTHRCNTTTLEKLCIPRLNIF